MAGELAVAVLDGCAMFQGREGTRVRVWGNGSPYYGVGYRAHALEWLVGNRASFAETVIGDVSGTTTGIRFSIPH